MYELYEEIGSHKTSVATLSEKCKDLQIQLHAVTSEKTALELSCEELKQQYSQSQGTLCSAFVIVAANSGHQIEYLTHLQLQLNQAATHIQQQQATNEASKQEYFQILERIKTEKGNISEIDIEFSFLRNSVYRIKSENSCSGGRK